MQGSASSPPVPVPLPEGAPWRAGLSAHNVGTSTVSGLTGEALLKEWNAMRQSAAAGAAYWDAQPGQHHPRSFTPIASPQRSFALLSHADSVDGRGSDIGATFPPLTHARAAAEQPSIQAGRGDALAGAFRSGEEESNGVAAAVGQTLAEQKIVPSERLSRPSLTDLFADLPAVASRSKVSSRGAAAAPSERALQERALFTLPQMSSGAIFGHTCCCCAFRLLSPPRNACMQAPAADEYSMRRSFSTEHFCCAL